MEIKLIEIRDRHTFIPALAIRLMHRTEQEHFLLRRAGYADDQISFTTAEPYILLCNLHAGEAIHYDSFAWANSRTWGTGHRHLIEIWNEIKSGDVIDVEFILGETQVAKKSERVE